MKKVAIMLDLETLGVGPTAPVIAVGAVAFDLSTGSIGDEFYEAITLESVLTGKFKLDPGTLKWWIGQSTEAKAAAFNGNARPLAQVLQRFAEWIGRDAEHVEVWGNSPAFDCVILKHALTVAQVPVPWRFWNERCFRTIKALHPGVEYVEPKVKHHALHDAKAQAEHLIKLLSF